MCVLLIEDSPFTYLKEEFVTINLLKEKFM